MALRAHKFCLPIISPKKKEVVSLIKNHLKTFQFFEVWLDYITDLDQKFASNLVRQFPNRIVFVFRRKNLSPMKMKESDRAAILSSLKGKKALVDFDYSTQKRELNIFKSKKIISYHNFEETPSAKKLHEIVKGMRRSNAHILKLATKCKSKKDADRLNSLMLKLRKDGDRFIVLGMGARGKCTRIEGALAGNAFNFAPLNRAGATAPGQLTIHELKAILQSQTRAYAR